MICKSGTLNLRNSQTGSSSCQCSTTSIGQEKEMMEFVFRIQKKSRITRRDSRKDTGRSSVLEMKRKRSGMELFLLHLKENKIPQPVKMVARFKDTSHPVLKRISAFKSWNSEKEEWQTLQRGCFEHRALIPNHSLCKSAQYLQRSYELV